MREPGRGFVDVGARERARRVVRRLAGHARVVVAEELDAVDAEDLRGRVQLATRRSTSCSPGASESGVFAELAPRVAETSTTRWPSLLARAMVPPVAIASSSGWAWNRTSVYGMGSSPA